MDTLAKACEPISAKQILDQSKLYRADVKSNQISAQLKSMEDNQLIESIDGPGKNKTYRIRERFFNIWYLMRYGKKYHKEEVLWLVRFLEDFCTEKELDEQIAQQIGAMKAGALSSQAVYFKSMALAHVGSIKPDQKMKLLAQSESFMKDQLREPEAKYFGKEKQKVIGALVDELMNFFYLPNAQQEACPVPDVEIETYAWVVEKVSDLIESRNDFDTVDYVKIRPFLTKGKVLNISRAIHGLALSYFEQDPDTMIALLQPLLTDDYLKAYYSMGYVYFHKKGNTILAEQNWKMAADLGNSVAMLNLGWLYHYDFKNFAEAKIWYEKAASLGNSGAMNNLGILLLETGQNTDESEKWFQLSRSLGNTLASNNLVHYYGDSKKWDKMLEAAEWALRDGKVLQDSNGINRLFSILLKHGQYHFLYNQFKKPQLELMKYARPYWYVLMWFMREAFPGEYEKLGSELKETVEDIIRAIVNMQKAA